MNILKLKLILVLIILSNHTQAQEYDRMNGLSCEELEEEPNYTGYDYFWWRWWYADKDIRDDKVTFFATHLYGESYEFSYIVRAQIPGTYTVNPAQGMLMYYTDVNGSSQDMVMKINDK